MQIFWKFTDFFKYNCFAHKEKKKIVGLMNSGMQIRWKFSDFAMYVYKKKRNYTSTKKFSSISWNLDQGDLLLHIF